MMCLSSGHLSCPRVIINVRIYFFFFLMSRKQGEIKSPEVLRDLPTSNLKMTKQFLI